MTSTLVKRDGKSAYRFVSKVAAGLLISAALSSQAFAAAPTGTSAVMQNSTATTVDVVINGTDFDNFYTSVSPAPDAGTLLKITYNGTHPTSVVKNSATQITATFPISMGTVKVAGDLVIDADSIRAAGTPGPTNATITITAANITDNANPVMTITGGGDTAALTVGIPHTLAPVVITESAAGDITTDGLFFVLPSTLATQGISFDTTAVIANNAHNGAAATNGLQISQNATYYAADCSTLATSSLDALCVKFDANVSSGSPDTVTVTGLKIIENSHIESFVSGGLSVATGVAGAIPVTLGSSSSIGMITGGGTYTGAGAITSASVTPTSHISGVANTTFDINYTDVGSVPSGGTIEIVFPPQYDISSVVDADVVLVSGFGSATKATAVRTDGWLRITTATAATTPGAKAIRISNHVIGATAGHGDLGIDTRPVGGVGRIATTTTVTGDTIIAGTVATAAQSTIGVGSATLPTGGTTTATVTLKDRYSNTLSTAVGSWTEIFSTAGCTIGTVTENANGTVTATVTAGPSSATCTISATTDDGTTAITSGNATITVNSEPAADSTTPIVSFTDKDHDGTYSAGDVIRIKFSQPIDTMNISMSGISINNSYSMGIAAINQTGTGPYYATDFNITLASSPTIVAGNAIVVATSHATNSSSVTNSSAINFTLPAIVRPAIVSTSMTDTDHNGVYSSGDVITIRFNKPISTSVGFVIGDISGNGVSGSTLAPANASGGYASDWAMTLGANTDMFPTNGITVYYYYTDNNGIYQKLNHIQDANGTFPFTSMDEGNFTGVHQFQAPAVSAVSSFTLTGLTANVWNMVSIPYGTYNYTPTWASATGLSGSSDSVYSFDSATNEYVENPTSINWSTGMWIKAAATSVTIPVTVGAATAPTVSGINYFDAYLKTLNGNVWNLQGVPFDTSWSTLNGAVRNTTVTVNAVEKDCTSVSVWSYDAANSAWNTTSNVPAGTAAWIKHNCKKTHTVD